MDVGGGRFMRKLEKGAGKDGEEEEEEGGESPNSFGREFTRRSLCCSKEYGTEGE